MTNIANRVIGGQGLMNLYCDDIKEKMNLYNETNDDCFAEMAEETADKVLKLFDYNEDEAIKALRANGIYWEYNFD